MSHIEEHVSKLAEAYPRMVAFARSKVGVELAEDVAQEAVLRLLRYRGIQDSQSFSLLLTIVHNVACTFVSKRRPDTGWGDDVAHDSAPRTSMCEARSAQALSDSWKSLPERQREVLLLTEVKGLTDEQASRVLGISRSAVNAHHRAAVERLKMACSESDAVAVTLHTLPQTMSRQAS